MNPEDIGIKAKSDSVRSSMKSQPFSASTISTSPRRTTRSAGKGGKGGALTLARSLTEENLKPAEGRFAMTLQNHDFAFLQRGKQGASLFEMAQKNTQMEEKLARAKSQIDMEVR